MKTKIIATLGPSCCSQERVAEMIKAGVSIFRFNTKHNSLEWHGQQIELVRQAAKKLKRPVAILLVLRGPEFRIGLLGEKTILLKEGDQVEFVSQRRENKTKGKIKTILVKHLESINGLKPGSTIYLDDGFLEAQVVKVFPREKKVLAKIIEGGVLKENKGINFPATTSDLPALVENDLACISLAGKKDIDFFSYSFVRNKEDILVLKKILAKKKLKARIVAKIEGQQAIDSFEGILQEADAVMIARGDLGIEIPLEKVPFYQKKIIKRCREEGKPVIVATQMLESMIQKPRPTRAEAADVANAVYDGTDALMLSGETATGCFPLKAIGTMKQIIEFIETKIKAPSIELKPKSLSEIITFSAYQIAAGVFSGNFLKRLKIKAFVVFTDTGRTVRFLSRLRPAVPILAITDSQQVRDQLCLSYGVIPFYHRFPQGAIHSTKTFLSFLKEKKAVKKGDQLVCIYGKQWGVPGQTNTIRVEKVG